MDWLLNYIYFHTAHSLIQSIRRKITDLSSNTTIVKSNISLIREQVATILYIIQEFYSNTNWVELHGSTIYEDFGEVLFLNYVDTISNQKKDKCMNKVINFFLQYDVKEIILQNNSEGYLLVDYTRMFI